MNKTLLICSVRDRTAVSHLILGRTLDFGNRQFDRQADRLIRQTESAKCKKDRQTDNKVGHVHRWVGRWVVRQSGRQAGV